jgi:predicted membrane protein (TIGR00267 family)
MTPLRMRLERWREYTEISEAGEIARRAFANNSFDGVLTMMGVVMGSFIVDVQDADIVLVTGISTALAIGVSGMWGAYLTESAERRHAIGELEQLTLTDLQDTKIGKASRMAVVLVALVDGLSPFLAAMLVVVPFLFASLWPSITYAYYASIGMALLALFGLGIFLGRLSRQNLILSGAKTVVAGVVCIVLVYFIEKLAG